MRARGCQYTLRTCVCTGEDAYTRALGTPSHTHDARMHHAHVCACVHVRFRASAPAHDRAYSRIRSRECIRSRESIMQTQ